ncbi:MAG TPA: phosphatase PAP2 family protein [Conexibacter sp.]|nr:phosphatase PAP2 family protein [Conexibacter sp.]
MDHSLLHLLNGFFARHDGVEDPFLLYSNASQMLFAGVLVTLFVLLPGAARHGARRIAVAAAASTGVALVVGAVLSHLVDRARPFVTDPSGIHMFGRHAADAGFPSDHATASFAIATAILLRSRRWGAVAMVLATVLAVTRVAIGVHYPSDVLAGAALGSAAALALWWTPIRTRLDAVAVWAGGLLDGAVARVRPGAAARS